LGAIDTETNLRLVIKSLPEIELLAIEFSTPDHIVNTGICIRRKFHDRPLKKDDPANPGVMIPARTLNTVFLSRGMRKVELNTELTMRMIRMIASINKRYPLSGARFLWSDYDKIQRGRALFQMPSDEELLELSLQSE
jgi:hypothetical protein